MADDITTPAPAPVTPAPAASTAPAPASTAPAPAPASTAPAPASPASTEAARFYEALPETWRDDIVSGMNLEPSQANVLGRYATFPKFVESFFHQHKKISAGEAATPASLPENATTEQVAEYRTKLGVPQTPEEYKVTLDEGLVLSDEDTRIVGEVFKVAHDGLVKPDVMSKMVNAMLAARETETEVVMAQHGIDQQTTTRVLKDTWKSDYASNQNITMSAVNRLPDTVRDDVMSAVLPDGKMLFNSPEVMVWLCDIARELNPAATVLPNSNDPVAGVREELKALEEQMRVDPSAWARNADGHKRYQELAEAEERMNKK